MSEWVTDQSNHREHVERVQYVALYQPSLLSMQSDDTMWWLSGSAPVALHHHLDWVIRQNYQQYPLWGQIFNKWRLQDMWRVNDVCYYYFNPTELNPCTLYKVLEFVTVEGNFNLVGGDKGIRNTIMAHGERWEMGDIQTIKTTTGPAMTWIRASEAAENIIPCPPATLPSPLLDCLFIWVPH